jgi:hypothetical protein
MQITIDVSESLVQQAKDAAARTHRSLDEFMADAILVTLDQMRRVQAREKFKITPYGTGGVFPGVDIDNTSALLDIMDGIEPKKD